MGRKERTLILEGIKHGSTYGYNQGCGCDPCTTAKVRTNAKVLIRQATGEVGKIPVADARKLMFDQAKKHDLPLKKLAIAAGLEWSVLSRISRGVGVYVLPRTYAALQRLPNLDPSLRTFVPAKASRLRMEAATVLGWGYGHALEQKRGLQSASSIDTKATSVTPATAQKYIDWLVHAMENPRPEQYAARRARNRGWRGPEAYDRDALLDPYWDGEGGLLEDKPVSGEELYREVKFLMGMGIDRAEALARVGKDAKWFGNMKRRYEKGGAA